MEIGGPRKRGTPIPHSSLNKKKSRPESFQPGVGLGVGVGSKSKPCTKFFSTSGCPFGEECHFLHHVPGGYKATSQMMSQAALRPLPTRNDVAPLPFLNGSTAPSSKSKLCKRYSSPEGCKFGEKCHYAHCGPDIGRPYFAPHDDPWGIRMGAPPPGLGAAADFGASATIKISIDASLAGAVIGRNGANSKQISRVTGVKLAIRDHESETKLRNIEVEGSFDQIQQANFMVRELIEKVKGAREKHSSGPGGGANLKTKLCDNFSKGLCTFGEKCSFAHGAEELRKTAI